MESKSIPARQEKVGKIDPVEEEVGRVVNESGLPHSAQNADGIIHTGMKTSLASIPFNQGRTSPLRQPRRRHRSLLATRR